jgi:hypothetical protein
MAISKDDQLPDQKELRSLMLDLRQVVSIVLLLVNGLWKIIRSGCNYESLEEQYQQLGQQVLTRLFAWTLEKTDERIMKTRDQRRYESLGTRKRTGVTVFGEFTVRRRFYRDRDTGACHFLLDEALGWSSERLSPKMRETALDLGTDMPFRRAARIMSRFVPGISAMSVWEVTKQAGAAARSEGEALRQAVFEDGEVPEGKHEASVLMLEADGVIVKQQKSRSKKAEVRLLTAYDGKETLSTGRRALQHRYSVAATRDADSFWDEGSARLATQWKLDKIEKVELGGDGASWVKQGSELFPNTVYHLDRFHLRENLTEALACSTTGYQAAVRAIEQHDQHTLIDILDRTAKQNQKAKRDRIKKLKHYLLDNWDGITSQIPKDGLGVIEGQVRHVIARRMKRIGARWSPGGTDRMARLLAAKANDELSRYLAVPMPMSCTLAKAVGGDTHRPQQGMRHRRYARLAASPCTGYGYALSDWLPGQEGHQRGDQPYLANYPASRITTSYLGGGWAG